MKRVYISGPMSGFADLNFPAFHGAAEVLRKRGYTVVNPAETDGGDTSQPYSYYLRKDIASLLETEAVVVLPGWRDSRGARLEVAIAEALGLPVLAYPDLQPASETILEEAQRLVMGTRGATYGHPLDDYARTSALWNALLAHKLKEPIGPEDAIRCMVAVKLSRDVHMEGRDNRVDIAGYALCLQRVTEERARRAGQGGST